MSVQINKVEREEDINQFLNEFFNFNYPKRKILFDNIKNIYALISFLNNNMEDLEMDDEDFRLSSEANLNDKIKLIDDFYRSIDVDFKFDKIIEDGTFEILGTNSLYGIADNELNGGFNNYYGQHKAIEVYNNGLLTDSITWVHEISHYRNQTDIERAEVNDMLTELLAVTESLIYTDYLEKLGYKKEATMFKIAQYNILYYVIKVSYPLMKIYLLYFLLGEVSKDNYKYLYKENYSYDRTINLFKKLNNREYNEIFTLIWYSIATIAIYNYERYKKDNSYIGKVKELNYKIQTDISLEDALKIIDIRLDSDSLNKILNGLNSFKNEIIKEKSNYSKI